VVWRASPRLLRELARRSRSLTHCLEIAGLYGRQPVLHGALEVRAERYVVGIPFHDYQT
jgi:hypothetical protein